MLVGYSVILWTTAKAHKSMLAHSVIEVYLIKKLRGVTAIETEKICIQVNTERSQW